MKDVYMEYQFDTRLHYRVHIENFVHMIQQDEGTTADWQKDERIRNWITQKTK